MAIRNSWTVGAHLVVDDESGFTHLSTEMVKDWDGQLRHKDNLDGRHPQLDVRARNDPQALQDIRSKVYPGVCAFTNPTIGETAIFRPITPATTFAGIGDMVIVADSSASACGPFIVYPATHGK